MDMESTLRARARAVRSAWKVAMAYAKPVILARQVHEDGTVTYNAVVEGQTNPTGEPLARILPSGEIVSQFDPADPQRAEMFLRYFATTQGMNQDEARLIFEANLGEMMEKFGG